MKTTSSINRKPLGIACYIVFSALIIVLGWILKETFGRCFAVTNGSWPAAFTATAVLSLGIFAARVVRKSQTLLYVTQAAIAAIAGILARTDAVTLPYNGNMIDARLLGICTLAILLLMNLCIDKMLADIGRISRVHFARRIVCAAAIGSVLYGYSVATWHWKPESAAAEPVQTVAQKVTQCLGNCIDKVTNWVAPKALPVLTQVDEEFDITTKHYVSAEALDGCLGGALAGKGSVFISCGEKHGLSPVLLAAIAMHETGNGTSKLVHQKNNAMGIFRDGTFVSFESIDDSVAYMAARLKGKLYVGGGKRTIAEIQQVYAPVNASNDPAGLNRHWQKGVTKYCNRILNATSERTGLLVANN